MAQRSRSSATRKAKAPDYLIRFNDLARVLAISRAHLYELAKTPDFPQPVRLSERVRAWRWSEIDAWLQRRRGMDSRAARRARR